METADTSFSAAILVVMEEHHSRSVIGETLQREGYELVFCDTGAQAIELGNNKVFDILIADNNLSDMSGIELVKNFAALPMDVTPIIVSDNASLEIALEGMKLGVHDYVMKPLNMTELKRNIESILPERAYMKQGATKFQDIIARLVFRRNPEIIVIVPHTTVDDDELSWGKRKLLNVNRFLTKIFKFVWDV